MGMMNASELKVKLDQAQEKVEKRLQTIQKLCKKLNVNYDDLIKAYSNVEDFKTRDYLPSKVAREIVGQFVQHIENTYDENGYTRLTTNDASFAYKENAEGIFDMQVSVDGKDVEVTEEVLESFKDKEMMKEFLETFVTKGKENIISLFSVSQVLNIFYCNIFLILVGLMYEFACYLLLKQVLVGIILNLAFCCYSLV